MEVRLRAPGLKLPRGHASDLVRRVREAFTRVAHRIVRVDVCVSTATDPGRPGLRDCMVEVHMADGRVELVQERQRRLGAALQRALKRAWYRAAQAIQVPLGRRGRMQLDRSSAAASR